MDEPIEGEIVGQPALAGWPPPPPPPGMAILLDPARECVDGCELGDDDHDCCAREHGACDGHGCDGCHNGVVWMPV